MNVLLGNGTLTAEMVDDVATVVAPDSRHALKRALMHTNRKFHGRRAHAKKVVSAQKLLTSSRGREPDLAGLLVDMRDHPARDSEMTLWSQGRYA